MTWILVGVVVLLLVGLGWEGYHRWTHPITSYLHDRHGHVFAVRTHRFRRQPPHTIRRQGHTFRWVKDVDGTQRYREQV